MNEIILFFVFLIAGFTLLIPLTWGFSEFALKCKMLIKRKKTGYDTFSVWLSKDQIIMLKYALIRTGDPDLFQLNDYLSEVLLENGFSPHLTSYTYNSNIKGETDDSSM